jgi:RHS repeat-associated protein
LSMKVSLSSECLAVDCTTFRYITDERGSVIALVNTATGDVAQFISYDVWGDVLSNSNPSFQPFGFAGGLYDEHTRLVRFGARDYDPSIGRWTAKDPILFNGGQTNLYVYVHNDPVNFVDPFGLWTVSVGLSGSFQFVGFNFNGSFGVVIDGSGGIGFIGSGGVGVGGGAEASFGLSFQVSDADCIEDLNGAGLYGSSSLGFGLAGSVDGFLGRGRFDQYVSGVGFTMGVGVGAEASVGRSYTSTMRLR